MSSSPIYATREEWLTAAIAEVRPLFQVEGFAVSDRIRVACGFPSLHSRSGALGECHASTASADQHYELLISPVLATPRDVLAVLIHELAHTLPGCLNHGQRFGAACSAMGLAFGSKGWKNTAPGHAFDAMYSNILDGLGPYPHAELAVANRKTQTTRMLKASCGCCGYTVRLTQKWADQGLPICPVDGSTLALA